MKPQFRITFEIVTEESAMHGDAEHRGFVTEDFDTPHENYMPDHPATFSLREAFDFLSAVDVECVECDSYPISLQCPPRWISFCGIRDEFGDCTSYALHPVKKLSPHSAIRLARLFNAYRVPTPTPLPAK